MNQPKLSLYVKAAATALTLAALFVRPAGAQTYTKLYEYPEDSRGHTGIVTPGLMTQGRDGNLYATNVDNGPFASGSAFKMTPSGVYTELYSFCARTRCADGVNPTGGLTLGHDGKFYGTTTGGGKTGFGTVFSLTAAGKLSTLYTFTGDADSGNPEFPAFQAPNGVVYGAGGEPYAGDYGLIYRLAAKPAPDRFSVLTTFTYTNGATPNMPLLAADGSFYGTAYNGGDKFCRCGAIFKMTPPHKLTVLHRFKGYPTDGNSPVGALAEGNDHNFYGVTYLGGTYNQGSIFKVTPAGHVTILHSFYYVASNLEGKNPLSGLTLGSDGNFYGSITGGAHGYGALYRVTPGGAVTLVYSFCPAGNGCVDGISPQTPLVQHTNGKFYGSTAGNSLGGSVFYSLDAGLAPFVSLLSPSGKAGDVIEMLGQGFNQAQGVWFNGVPARFTAASDGALEAVVPAGATSGYVRVMTRTGTLASSRVFAITR